VFGDIRKQITADLRHVLIIFRPENHRRPEHYNY